MRSIEVWFAEYGESHQHPTNRLIHKICVPAIFFSIVGMLLLIPYNLGPLRIGEIVIILALLWYATLGLRAFVVMLCQLGLSYVLFYALNQMTDPLIPLIAIFVLAWIGQFLGHKIEGKKPSFFKDLQFLLIGPLWVVKDLFFKA